MVNFMVGFKKSKLSSQLYYVTCTKFQIVLVHFHSVLPFILLMLLIECKTIDTFVNPKNDKILDSCQRCKILVDSFKEGLKRTARGKHEGGDAHWEESKLSNYVDSEIRLTEIQENLCNEIKIGKDQCHSFAENYESELEEWFLNNRKKERQANILEGSTLYEYLCNQISNVCCPEGHFGSDCKPCHGFPDNVCFNRGYCHGNGTRQGKGNCICHRGFDGKFCEKCSASYLASGTIEITIDNQITTMPEQCLRCDLSCATSCHSLGPKGCHVCKTGYFWDNDLGCIDVDECNTTLELNPCKFNTYCMNTQGSYKCFPCHESCQRCRNKGPSSCIECAPNYEMSADSKCIKNENHWHEIPFRYFIYIASMVVIFFFAHYRNNILIASCLSVLVTIFITIIEMPDMILDFL